MDSLKRIFGFALFFSIFYLGLMLAFSKLSFKGIPLIYQTNDFYALKGGGTYEQFQTFDKTKTYDILFFGSSKSYRGYDPKLFAEKGLETYNLGSNSQTIANTFQVLKNSVHPDRCKLVIVDVFAGAFSKKGIESSVDLITNASDGQLVWDVIKEMKDSRSLNLYVSRWFTQNRGALYTDEDYREKGFAASEAEFSIPEDEPVGTEKVKREEIYVERQLEAFREMIDYTQENGIELLLILSPNRDTYSADRHQRFVEHVLPIIDEKNATYWDYSKKLNLSSQDHFYDYLHLNYEGVKIFNTRLMEDLLTNYDF